MKSYVNQVAKSTRILSHGKIDKLPFKLDGGQFFSIYPRPRADNTEDDDTIDTLVTCRMVQDADDAFSEFPVQICSWSPGAFVEITEAELDRFDFYVGAHNEWNCNDEALPHGTVGVEQDYK